MLTNSSIILRINNFLKGVLPFSMFSNEDLLHIAKHCEITVFRIGDAVFKKDQKPSECFYIVRKGAIDIIDRQGDLSILIDKCGEGDMFGIRPILAESPYLMDAICSEDAIVYQVPIKIFKKTYHKDAKAVDYMIKRFAAGMSIRDDINFKSIDQGLLNVATQIIPVQNPRTLVYNTAKSSIMDAIQKMNVEGVSSIILVDEEHHPVGIITDRDIRRFIAENANLDQPAEAVMSKPVRCIPQNVILEEVQLIMIESGLHHLCITVDGTNQSEALGMVTEHDILYAGASDPVVILKKIKSATRVESLIDIRRKIDKLSYTFVSESINKLITLQLIDRLNRTLIQKTVAIALKEHLRIYEDSMITEQTFSFFTMGSAARGEQILMTDQDNGVIITNEHENLKEEYLVLGKRITDHLATIGYKYCPADMMASDRRWCQTVDNFKKEVYRWMMNPGPEEILNTSIFFDFRHEYGNPDLFKPIKNDVKKYLGQQDQFLRFLANQAVMNPPPLSFFRKIIIEKDGEHKDMFDIKLRAISPLSNIARVLALDEGYLETSGTIQRFKIMMEVDQPNAILYEDAIESFLELLAFRIRFALKNGDSGRFIDPGELDKVERIQLRRCFSPSRKLIDMVERKYHLGFM